MAIGNADRRANRVIEQVTVDDSADHDRGCRRVDIKNDRWGRRLVAPTVDCVDNQLVRAIAHSGQRADIGALGRQGERLPGSCVDGDFGPHHAGMEIDDVGPERNDRRLQDTTIRLDQLDAWRQGIDDRHAALGQHAPFVRRVAGQSRLKQQQVRNQGQWGCIQCKALLESCRRRKIQ